MPLRLTPAATGKIYTTAADPGRSYPEFPALPGRLAVGVPVAPSPWAKPLCCFHNVSNHLEASQGGIVFGWALWTWPGVNIEAIHHAVWRSTDGALVDITPPPLQVASVTFIEDQDALFDVNDVLADAKPTMTHWMTSSLAAQAYRAAYEDYNYLDRTTGEYLKKHGERWHRAGEQRSAARAALILELAGACASGDMCFCRSQQTFANCCGPNFTA
ncbi:MAG: hypothetical protein EON91_04605 [Brevundimonas sp.]|uniref:hypothetical protein n=1 Tax=Brevundimonas sp. TaxID=1871086 RepID=UPI00120C8B10|nr:hypothetical protein [Brevundimonas sp.]RZJ18614.1 MAG: hypothetical protein EON91_04605 [Brevundimonas sp.]